MFDDRFVHVNIVCFDVGCFYLQYEIYAPSPHLGKGALSPHDYYYYIYIIFCAHRQSLCRTRGIPCPYPTCVSNTWPTLSLSYMCV